MPLHKGSLHRDIVPRSHRTRSPDCPQDDAMLVSVIAASGQRGGETSWLDTAFARPFRKPARNCSPNEGSTREASRTSLRRRVFRKEPSTTTSRARKVSPQRL